MLVCLGDGLIETDEVLYARESSPGIVEVVFKDGSRVRFESSDPEADMAKCASKSNA